MDRFISALRQGIERQDGYQVADAFTSVPPPNDPGRFTAMQLSVNSFTVQSEIRSLLKPLRIDPDEKEAWIAVSIEYYKGICALLAAEEASAAAPSSSDGTSNAASWTAVYTAWKDLLNTIHRAYSQSNFDPWSIPLLYTTTRSLRRFAILADAATAAHTAISAPAPSLEDVSSTDPSAASPSLEDCARQTNRVFALVTQDRGPPPNRKYGTYAIAVLLFKTYFRLGSVALCKNIVRSIDAAAAGGDMPPLDHFPKAHQVGYRYYVGVVAFLDERYAQAEEELLAAWGMCLAGEGGERQAERILGYLIPTRLITKHQLPSRELLGRCPRLKGVLEPLCDAVRKGDLKGFDEAISDGEDEFVRLRIYLTLERGRDVCLRNLLRKVYLAGGFEDKVDESGERVRKSRISIAEFRAGLSVGGEHVDADEVEAMIAGMIYKNLMKGYISRAHSMVVLNKKGAFPGTGV